MRKLLFLIGILLTAFFFFYCISNHKFSIQADVADRVAEATELPDGVILNISGRDVTLTGVVASQDVKDLIAAQALDVYGVRVVNNLLEAPPRENTVEVAPEEVPEPAAVVEVAPEAVPEPAAIVEVVPEEVPEPAVVVEVTPEAVQEPAAVVEVAPKPVPVSVPTPVKFAACEKNLAAIVEKEKVNFAFGKAVIKNSSYPVLNMIVDAAKKCSASILNIHGHTDSSGEREANRILSLNRAKAVGRYLIERGVKQTIHVYGHGPDKPIANNATTEGRAKNRRIEFKVEKLKN